jgi:hypothetical protein
VGMVASDEPQSTSANEKLGLAYEAPLYLD